MLRILYKIWLDARRIKVRRAPDRGVEYTTPRDRRFEPSPEEMAEEAQLFGDMTADRIVYHRELAASL